jgi:hypothetical protein
MQPATEISRDQTDHERLIDEMVVALCGLRRLDDETHCILALIEQGFRAADVAAYFDEAMVLARMTRADWWDEITDELANEPA